MLIQTLDGHQVKWRLETASTSRKSTPHKKVLKLLKEVYPTTHLLEEVQIEVKKHKYLYPDFYIPLYKIAIEIDGSQHKEYNQFFHKNQYKFVQSQINDSLKQMWCDLNNITLIRLTDDEKEEEWKNKLPHWTTIQRH